MKLVLNILFLLLFLLSCGTKTKFRAPTAGKPSWYKMPERFRSQVEYSDKVHPFFDLNPFWDFSKQTVDFFLIDKVGDRVTKGLDLISGNLYKNKLLCRRRDVWKKRGVVEDHSGNYRENFWVSGKGEEIDDLIHFSFGIIPRTLNSINSPLEIIVLGKKSYFYESHKRIVGQKVRIIASVVFEECTRINCLKSQNWTQREILVGINPFDTGFKNILTLSDFKKKKYDDLIGRYLENLFGSALRNEKAIPTSRSFRFISSKAILQRIKTKNTIFNIKKISSLKKNCFYLYDHIWNRIESLKKIKRFRKNAFVKVFSSLHKKFSKDLKTCFQYVPSSNINNNSERHWFFEYLKNIINLSKLGINYSCQLSFWDYENTLKKGSFEQCSFAKIDQAFRFSINVNKILSNKYRAHYRYITYDNGQYGTHHKIYSWVRDNGKKYNCVQLDHDYKTIFPNNVKTLDINNL